MRNTTLKPWIKKIFSRQVPCILAMFGMMAFTSARLYAMPSVATLGGGNPNVSPPFQGYQDGDTLSQALFHTPAGLALDSTGQYLFVADRDNNAIRWLDLVAGQTWTLALTDPNLINQPIAVALDTDSYFYVLNRGNGTNGSVITFDLDVNSIYYGDAVVTNAFQLVNAAGMSLDSSGNIYVTVQSNQLIRIAAYTTNQTTIATITNAGVSLQGIIVKRNGLIAACDAGRNGIYLINPATGIVSTNAGFHGTGDFATNGNNIATITTAKFNQPTCVTEAGDGTLIVSDYGNNRVKAVLNNGVVTNLYGVTAQYWGGSYPGWYDGNSKVPDSIAPNAQSRLPFGVVMASDGSIYTSEDYYHLIRKVTGTGLPLPPPTPPDAPTILTVTTNYGQVSLTWSTSAGATNYNVKRSTSSGSETTIASTTGTSYTDTAIINGTTYYYVVSALNAGGEGPNSLEVSATPPIPPPPAPRIGWFDYEGNNQTGYFTVLHPFSILTFNNDQLFAIDPATNGVSTYYISGPAPLASVPSSTNGSTPPFYQDNLTFAQPLSLTTVPDLMISAINVDATGQSSPITTAEILFQVANPTVGGYNGAQFTVSDITSNAVFWYTLDGTVPTNAPPSIGPIAANNTNSVTISINVNSNVLFTVRAFRNGYEPSGSALQSFSPSNFVANTISFGFASGEASSDFVASPGQTFYAPVTLSVLPGATIYSLQFNVTVTNTGPNPGPAVAPGAFTFSSFLMQPDPALPGLFIPIPPYMFVENGSNPPPTSGSFLYNGNWFENLVFTNSSINLLGVGWIERYTRTNLYVTTSQDLIAYSMAHDVLYSAANGSVEVGGYAFQVPSAATNGQTYQIQIARPSATDDGIGAPGSDVFIAAPTNGSTAGGSPINALKNVTVGQRKYIAGSVYPFRWFNAGDFGSSNIVNADVEQVYQSATYGPVTLNVPPRDTDFYDAMDSCGNIGVVDGDNTDPNFGYYTNSYGSLSPAQLNALFDGNDTNINQIAFGDGTLDVCDVYLTFRRSLDPSLTWFRRFWNNGQRVADTGAPNVASHIATQASSTAQTKGQTSGTTPPQVNFTAGDIVGSAGQVVQIPITATIFGSYPLRVLMLNLTVEPLDGSPALTTPVQFNQVAPLGAPYITDSQGNNNYSAAWLNSTNAGLTGSVTIGTLTVTIPAGATANAAYAIHFDHASASPNGLASFPKQTLTGLITLASRTNSSYGDGIPDSWRLRWFGTVNNLLSVSNACPTSDGIINWNKYVAGVDPTAANDFPSTNLKTPAPSGSTAAIHWPTVSGKQYVIELSSSLYSGKWTAISTNTGTGTDMEFDDNNTGTVKFYRVLILP